MLAPMMRMKWRMNHSSGKLLSLQTHSFHSAGASSILVVALPWLVATSLILDELAQRHDLHLCDHDRYLQTPSLTCLPSQLCFIEWMWSMMRADLILQVLWSTIKASMAPNLDDFDYMIYTFIVNIMNLMRPRWHWDREHLHTKDDEECIEMILMNTVLVHEPIQIVLELSPWATGEPLQAKLVEALLKPWLLQPWPQHESLQELQSDMDFSAELQSDLQTSVSSCRREPGSSLQAQTCTYVCVLSFLLWPSMYSVTSQQEWLNAPSFLRGESLALSSGSSSSPEPQTWGSSRTFKARGGVKW